VNLDLRAVTQDDKDAYYAFHHALAAERPKGRHFTDDHDIEYAFHRAILSDTDDDRIHKVCWEKERIIGEAFTYGQPDEAYTGIIFLEERCGFGFGVLCMDVLVAFAKERRWRYLYSNVWEDNGGALRLNLRYGFRPVSARFIRHPYGDRRDVIVWTLRLDLLGEMPRR